MIKWSLLLFVFWTATQCTSSSSVQTEQQQTAKSVAKTITAESLSDKVYALASDEFQGRETGEIGQSKAANYLKQFYVKQQIKGAVSDTAYYQHISSSYFNGQYGATENVAAFIKGSEWPEQVVVLSAHYDHEGIRPDGTIYYGADDDASGTAAVMQIAAAFKAAVKQGNRPKRSILFLHFTGEEKGLLGSKFYAENPLYPLANTVTDLNIDMIGRVDARHASNPNYIYLIGSDRLSSDLDSVVNRQNRIHTKLALDYKYNAESDPNRYYYRSDHYNFAKHNIPVIFFFNGVHADYHQPTDTPDKINYPLLAKRTKLIFYTAWKVANRPERLVVDKAN